MSAAQCHQALENGMALVRQLPGNALLLGEMGIGNTSAAALLLARLGGLELAHCVGAGTGLDAELMRSYIAAWLMTAATAARMPCRTWVTA